MDDITYSNLALRTADPQPKSRTCTAEITPTGHQMQLLLAALGLCGEAGEIAEMVKKHVFHGHEFDVRKCIREGGDVQWYLNYFAERCCGVSLGDMKQANIDKLRARYPEGHFTQERSKNRAEGDD